VPPCRISSDPSEREDRGGRRPAQDCRATDQGRGPRYSPPTAIDCSGRRWRPAERSVGQG